MSHSDQGHWRDSRWNQALREIRRLPSKGVVAGVLAGIGDYMGWNPRVLRVLAVLLCLFVMGPLALCLYALAWYLIDPVDKPGYAADSSGPSPRPNRPRPSGGNLRTRFSSLEKRLCHLEEAVTSSDFHLKREFDRLERSR